MSESPLVTLPNNVGFEAAVLGAAITDADALDMVTGQLRAEHFYNDQNKVVFEQLSAFYNEGRRVDEELLARNLEQNGALGAVDPHGYIAQIVAASCVPSAVEERIKDIIACFDARTLYQSSQKMSQNALDSSGDREAIENALSEASEKLGALTDQMVAQPWVGFDDIVHEATTDTITQPLFASGLTELDRTLNGGFRAGQVVVIAARPAQGKSTLAVDIARHATIRQNAPGLLVSLEMSPAEIGARILSAEASVDLSRITTLTMSEHEYSKVSKVAERASGAPLYVVTPDGHWPRIRSYITAAHRRLDIKFAIIDYLQLIDSDGGPPGTPREQVVARVSRACKNLARALNITILLVSQLNRGPEQRTGGKPQVSDLRESGQVEQDADIVILIHQPQTYDPDTERAGEADLIIGKQRNGSTGTVATAFQGHYSRFSNMSYETEPV